jgi:UDPglucose 6-dehydrogenase
MKICVIGTGYVGLVSGACLADLGNTVICIDNNLEKLTILQNDEVPFFEPQLAEKIERNRLAGRLHFSDDLSTAVQQSEFIFIAVGTPPMADGSADLSAVFSVAQSVISIYKQQLCSDFKILITKSTVPVGTGNKIEKIRDSQGLNDDKIAVASNPEFLREGSAVYDFFHPDRIVIGSSSQKALDRLEKLYTSLFLREAPIVRTDLLSSELSKYASNAFLATKISFINEMSNICELTGADIKSVAKIMGMDGRIGKYFLHPGPGYGGSCFPKDTQALIKTAADYNYDLKTVKAVEAVNDLQKKKVIHFVKEYFGSDLTGKIVCILGLAFKPNTDDVRDASSIVIIEELIKLGAKVKCYDPEVKSLVQFSKVPSVEFSKNIYEAVQDANAVTLVTEWHVFRELDLAKIKTLMKEPVFFDLRNVYSPSTLMNYGFDAYVIGRQVIK